MDHHEIDIEDQLLPMTKCERPYPLQGRAVTCCLDSVRSRLEKREGGRGWARSFQAQAPSCTIFRVPEALREIDPKAVKPELVSIGPYHRCQKRLPEVEELKWFLLESFLRRTDSNVESLINLVADEASSAWNFYSEPGMTLDKEFVEMMLLDGCFVVELLLHVFRKANAVDKNDPILTRRWIIPILIRDLLKLENQVPYSLLQSLFDYSHSTKIEAKTPYLSMLALRVFNLGYPALRDEYTDLQYQLYDDIKSKKFEHLLNLFHFALFVTNRNISTCGKMYLPSSVQSMPCVSQLRASGIKFKAKNTVSFLDISLRKRVLKIPTIAINDFMITVLINCIALEQCQESLSKPITDYVSFMHCLINQQKDVSLLCSDGIISTLSFDFQYVVDLFNKLAKSIVFSVEDCYLSQQFKELESYHNSNWAILIRTYFSSPWAAVSVFSASLVIALTVTQTVYAVLGH